ncbi:DNA-binding protein [Nocardia nova]|uniref:DNA-binding protein n=1 Tax=Nocardia nova TaxID=37330 RepID=A0A2S6AI81_9NOCA|nr:helix-turn-helix domain-containing protein [Nocardia nova]PPJ24153.1 DNA-binding protein [Nocardia nova]PPJ34923.1 DNA-binding protein [Nocardia nova]
MAEALAAPSEPDRWLTRSQVADRLQVPVKTLAQWAYQGRGPRFRRMGKHVRYLLADLIAWEQTQFAGGSDAA